MPAPTDRAQARTRPGPRPRRAARRTRKEKTPNLCSRSEVGKRRRNEIASYSAVSVPFMLGWTSQKNSYVPAVSAWILFVTWVDVTISPL